MRIDWICDIHKTAGEGRFFCVSCLEKPELRYMTKKDLQFYIDLHLSLQINAYNNALGISSK